MKESLAKAAAWLSHHRWGVLWTVIAMVGLYVLALQGFLEGGPQSVPVLLTLAGLAIALHFGHCFTRDLPATGERVSAELRCIFRYAYGFLVIAMLFSVSPFVVPKCYLTPSGTLAGVVYGCQRTEVGYGSELTRCADDDSDQQWLLQIGSLPNRAEAIDEHALAELAKKAQAACTAPERWSALDSEFEALGRPDGAALVAVLKGACQTGGAATAEDMAAVLRERGVAARDRSEILSRGLVVPLYVVVLALFGGAVGMSRRMPEIQRWAAASTKRENPKKAITAIEARERVVFQIMQVLAAPLIAITAFAAFEPDTMTAAVLIGFASGFASESILMKLRQASNAVVGNKGRNPGPPDAPKNE